MSPEYKGDGFWTERSHKEAAVQLVQNIGKGLPRFYLQSLVEHPGWTGLFTLEVLGWGLILLGQEDIGSGMLLAGIVSPCIGLAANAIQIGANIWNEYRLGTDPKEITGGIIENRILKFRNFL